MWAWGASVCSVVFFNAPSSTDIYTLSLHDALPISCLTSRMVRECGIFPDDSGGNLAQDSAQFVEVDRFGEMKIEAGLSPALDVLSRSKSTEDIDRKSTRLNSSH